MYICHNVLGTRFFTNSHMNEDLEALGISLDFYFPNKALEQKLKFITEITPEIIELYKGREGIHTLCEALYIKWRYWNHWSYGEREDKDFDEEILLLTLLYDVTKEERPFRESCPVITSSGDKMEQSL